jgi:adenine deaminase
VGGAPPELATGDVVPRRPVPEQDGGDPERAATGRSEDETHDDLLSVVSVGDPSGTIAASTALEVDRVDSFVRGLPKAELHLHIEGTLEPELLFELASRNAVGLPYRSIDELRAAYSFGDLQDFLDLYYQGAAVLQTEADFHEMTWAYLERAAADGVRRAEVFFDPQTHTDRGVPFEAVIGGINAALEDGERRLGISTGLIMCFLRHLTPAAAMESLEQGLAHREMLLGVGLDSSEVGNPPAGFADVFARAEAEDLHRVAHAGEEGPPAYVWQALDLLHAERIDHGVRAMEDDRLVNRLRRDEIPLTMCPLSNVALGVFDSLAEHPLKEALDAGLRVTVNSDDPAYFGGYVADNYTATAEALDLTREELVTLAANSIEASFLDDGAKRRLGADLEAYAAAATASEEASAG